MPILSIEVEGKKADINATVNEYTFIGVYHNHTSNPARVSFTLAVSVYYDNVKIGIANAEVDTNKNSNIHINVEDPYFIDASSEFLSLIVGIKDRLIENNN